MGYNFKIIITQTAQIMNPCFLEFLEKTFIKELYKFRLSPEYGIHFGQQITSVDDHINFVLRRCFPDQDSKSYKNPLTFFIKLVY